MKNLKNLTIAFLTFIIICLISANVEWQLKDKKTSNEIKDLNNQITELKSIENALENWSYELTLERDDLIQQLEQAHKPCN